jgi:sterol desaturase/sphingolipid hydroxylase (fatty acid hydroxylase superfamily)
MDIAQFQTSSSRVLFLLFLSTVAYGVCELLYLHLGKRAARLKEYKVAFFGMLSIILVAVGVAMLYGRINTAIIGIWGSQFALFDTDLSWYWWLYGLLVYEFFYWLQHYLAHKIRFFWCLHSPHHAPESMNMFVGFNHSCLESVFYMPFFLGFFPALLGVDPVILIVCNIVDAVWGSMIHISDHLVSKRLGILERFLQTPAYHRAHHAQNIVYMDTNYCSITLFWDWFFGTLQPLKDDEVPKYGITRSVKTSSFLDVHFGEFALLWKDMLQAPTWRIALAYMYMPPGWTHKGELETVAFLKKNSLKFKP